MTILIDFLWKKGSGTIGIKNDWNAEIFSMYKIKGTCILILKGSSIHMLKK